MSATVYTTAGGRRFHFDRRCRARIAARDLNDWDCEEYGLHQHPKIHAVRTRSNLGAALLGYTACRVCVPPAHALPATGETYGHEPFGPYDGALICRRCYTEHRGRRRVVLWPCTSASVLGLVERGGE